MSVEDRLAGARTSAELEYLTLREEILRRIEGRQQLISITLTVGGAFLGVGWGGGPVVLLIYPVIGTLLAAAWAQNEARIHQLSNYIHEQLEGAIPGLGWEKYSRQREPETHFMGWPLETLALGGIFLLIQVMALGLGIYQFRSTLIEWILLGVDVVAILITLGLIQHVRAQSR